jgi:hypothetical protein
MKQIELKDMPRNYAFCSHEECSRRKTCLHWLAYKEYPVMMQNVFYNLRWIEEQGGANNCPNYADSAPVSYAIGAVYQEFVYTFVSGVRLHFLFK